MQPNLDSLRIKIFADGADRKAMVELYRNPRIKGFTTNPTLMRKDGVSDYEQLCSGSPCGDPRSAHFVRGAL